MAHQSCITINNRCSVCLCKQEQAFTGCWLQFKVSVSRQENKPTVHSSAPLKANGLLNSCTASSVCLWHISTAWYLLHSPAGARQTPDNLSPEFKSKSTTMLEPNDSISLLKLRNSRPLLPQDTVRGPTFVCWQGRAALVTWDGPIHCRAGVYLRLYHKSAIWELIEQTVWLDQIFTAQKLMTELTGLVPASMANGRFMVEV